MSTRAQVRLLLLVGAVFALANVALLTAFWPDIRPKLAHYKQRVMELDRAHNEALDRIAAHVAAVRFDSETQKLDYVRSWVYRNSVHQIDEEHDAYATKTHVVVPMLWRRHAQAGEAPHLACGSRTYAMKAILQRLGIPSRVIDVYRVEAIADPPRLRSHTFLEVWNKQTASWEIQDADLDISYQHSVSGKRASVFEMVMGDIDTLEPVNQHGRGWYSLRLTTNKTFFGLAVYRLQYEGERSVVVANPGRLEREPRLRAGAAEVPLIEHVSRRHHQPVVFYGSGLAGAR